MEVVLGSLMEVVFGSLMEVVVGSLKVVVDDAQEVACVDISMVVVDTSLVPVSAPVPVPPSRGQPWSPRGH